MYNERVSIAEVMSVRKPPLEVCPICRAVLVVQSVKGTILLWCSKNPLHFRWEKET